jgi:putative glutamine amidotransferase
MLIAIPTNTEETSVKLNKAYVDYVLGAGFTPVLVPQSTLKMNVYADMCDGLLLPGGKDIDPMYYGENNESSYGVDPEKDLFERTLFLHFVAKNKPVFGICRGLQLIGAEFIMTNRNTIGDKLVFLQHIGEHDRNNNLKVTRHWPTHFVSARNRLLYGVDEKGWKEKAVNSMHHQYIHVNVSEKNIRDRLVVVDGLIISAFTRIGVDAKTIGGVVEGLVIPLWNAAAVQWHPEELKDYALIQKFFSQGVKEWQAVGQSRLDSSVKTVAASN